MPSFGENLRRERKARNIRLRDIAESTKISSIYLRALEADDFGQLPGRVFNRGYVRAYAEFIGVDPAAAVAAYEHAENSRAAIAEGEDGPGRPAFSPRISNRSPGSGARMLSVSAVAIAILLAAGASFMAWRSGSTIPAAEPENQATAEVKPPPPILSEPSTGRTGDTPSGEAGGAGHLPQVQKATLRPAATAESATVAPEQEAAAAEAPRRVERIPAPAPRPPATAAAPSPVPSGATELSIPDFGIGAKVIDRSLAERRSAFVAGERVYFWTRVLGGEPGASVRHVWLKNGRPVSDIAIGLGGPHWRTHTWQSMRDDCDGQWSVEARDAGNQLLATSGFTCGH
jgi:cytoskeleton protein RodZ